MASLSGTIPHVGCAADLRKRRVAPLLRLMAKGEADVLDIRSLAPRIARLPGQCSKALAETREINRDADALFRRLEDDEGRGLSG